MSANFKSLLRFRVEPHSDLGLEQFDQIGQFIGLWASF